MTLSPALPPPIALILLSVWRGAPLSHPAPSSRGLSLGTLSWTLPFLPNIARSGHWTVFSLAVQHWPSPPTFSLVGVVCKVTGCNGTTLSVGWACIPRGYQQRFMDHSRCPKRTACSINKNHTTRSKGLEVGGMPTLPASALRCSDVQTPSPLMVP